MLQGICLTWSGVMHGRKRKRLLLCGLASCSRFMCVVMNFSWRQITNHSNVFLARCRNHPQEWNDGSYNYSVMTTRLFTIPGGVTLWMHCRE